MSLHSDVALHLQRFVHFSFLGCLHRLPCQLEAEMHAAIAEKGRRIQLN